VSNTGSPACRERDRIVVARDDRQKCHGESKAAKEDHNQTFCYRATAGKMIQSGRKIDSVRASGGNDGEEDYARNCRNIAYMDMAVNEYGEVDFAIEELGRVVEVS